MTANESVCGVTLWPVGSSVVSRRTGGRTGSGQRSLSFNRPARMRPILLTRMSSSPIVYHQTSLYRLVTERRTLIMTSRIQKRLLLPKRVRHPPREGFSWVDRRFLKDYAARLSRDAILLYFFFSAASDQHGLSFYSDATARRQRALQRRILQARLPKLMHWRNISSTFLNACQSRRSFGCLTASSLSSISAPSSLVRPAVAKHT